VIVLKYRLSGRVYFGLGLGATLEDQKEWIRRLHYLPVDFL
jgi:hypothetical protein